MGINIKIDDGELKKSVKKLSAFPKEIPKATSAALNRTITFTKKRVNQEVRKNYNIKSSEVSKTLEVTKSNPSNLSATIKSTGHRLTLGRFARNTGSWKRGKAVKVKIKKSGIKSVNTYPKAFVIGLTGNIHVVKRVSKSKYPIQVLRTLSVPQMISKTEISESISKEAQDKLKKRIKHEVEYRLSRHMK